MTLYVAMDKKSPYLRGDVLCCSNTVYDLLRTMWISILHVGCSLILKLHLEDA